MKSKYTRHLLVASLVLGTSPLAYAQQKLDTIIVTGVGPERETDEMIGNATAVDRTEIVDRLAASLGDTLDSQPGVSSTFFGPAASRPVLRGLGAERVLVLTNGIGVIDVSAASPDHQVTADGIDAEKIEILRGPAALAYGGQAIGGVVNVIDGLIVEELPEESISGEVFAAGNSVNDGTELAGRGQFAAGPFVLTLSGSMRDFDDYEIPGFAESALQRALEEEEHHDEDEGDEGEEHDHEEEEEAYGLVENTFVETETLSAGLSWIGEDAFFGVAVRQQTAEYGLPGHSHHHHEEEEGEGEGEEEGHEEEEESPFIDLEQLRIDVRGGLTLDTGIFTDLAGTLSISDYEHTEFEAPGEPGTLYETDGFEGRLELGTLIGAYEGAVGLQFLDKDFEAVGDEAFITPTETETFGVFAYQTREWDSGVGIEGGLRYDTTELDNEIFGAVDFDLFSGSFGVHKHLSDGWFIGGQISYSERAPSESELFADGEHIATSQYEVGNPGIDKEKATNVELTLRWQSDNFKIGGNVFVTDFSNFIYLTPGVTTFEGAVVDEVDELPVFVFLEDGADFFGAEFYAEADLAESVLGADWTAEASVDFVNGDLDTGGNVPFLPPLTFHGAVQGDWGLVSAGLDLTVAGDQDDPGAGELPTDGYTTLGLKAALDLSELGFGKEGTQVFVDARNITDEEIRYSTSVLKDVVPAPGQNIRFGLRAKF